MHKDRDYHFLVKTFDTPAMAADTARAAIATCLLPCWRSLHEAGVILSAAVWHKIGDLDIQTESSGVRDWNWFVSLELASGADGDLVVQQEEKSGISRTALREHGIDYLSNELMVRPAGAGTAVPRPSSLLSGLPENFSAGVEYINIPEERWRDYQQFMRTVFGPIGACMVEMGACYQVAIMERVKTYLRHQSLPTFNRVHVLISNFEDMTAGFFPMSSVAVERVVGKGHTLESALAPAASYRRKPRMSRNRLERDLSIAFG